MIYVTHDQVEAMTLADKIVVLKDGEVMQIGSADGPLPQSREPLRGGLSGRAVDEFSRCEPFSSKTKLNGSWIRLSAVLMLTAVGSVGGQPCSQRFRHLSLSSKPSSKSGKR
jgi:multiple sugar transport system ATP-binding protein